ncbi:M20 family metallopeptidase [Prosthecobacter vanneervenii]|uniref:Probable succinyl-diaminopimelate desuccinylase n=1 Tax=Prosthecobacter vanneervenii TaxID=48466 RepID=A0A7W8DJE6_9BACT|nr:M20 family metallopeptidase [Prosthecobacter vanneervenii]MBB5032059.1 acetylornithine deacetylase [Prosthecobacter vanneervenii]
MSPVLQTLADLVRINSINSSYEGGPGEAEAAAYVRKFFEQRGIEVWEQEVFPGRNNVIARIPGRDSTRRLVFEAHMDTVSIKGMTIDPFDPVVRDGKMHGRGSVDDKAGLAAMMHAVADIHASGELPPCEVWMAAVVDEEYSFRGVVKLCEGLKADAAVVAEPTEFRCVIASKGVLRWRIKTKGKAAHSSKPHLGINAITAMARVVLALNEDHARMQPAAHPLLGPGTCNVGVINGGVQVNFVPDEALIEIDRRLLPGEEVPQVLAHYQVLLDALMKQHPDVVAEMEEPMLQDWAFQTDAGEPLVQLARTLLGEMGRNDEVCGVPFGSDASKFSRMGIPTILFGPGSIDQAHAAVEYVECAEVEKALAFYTEVARRFV